MPTRLVILCIGLEFLTDIETEALSFLRKVQTGICSASHQSDDKSVRGGVCQLVCETSLNVWTCFYPATLNLYTVIIRNITMYIFDTAWCTTRHCAGGFGMGPNPWREFSTLLLSSTGDISRHADPQQFGRWLGCIGDLRPCSSYVFSACLCYLCQSQLLNLEELT